MSSTSRRSASRSKVEEMISVLREEMLAGVRSEGDFLPSELELGEQYQLSKNTVRKGLEILVSEGYIEKIPRIGARVRKPEHEDTITIKFGYYPSLIRETNILKLVESFSYRHPNINVLPVPVHYPREHGLIHEYLSRDMIDIMTVNVYDFEFLSGAGPDRGILEPVETENRIYPFLNRSFTIDNRLYVKPFVFSPVVLCYNKEHFQESGLPEPDSGWTWEDVRRNAMKLANGNNRFGLYFQYHADNRWPLFLLQNGVTFRRGSQGKFDLNDPKLLEGLRLCQDLISDQTIFPTYVSENDNDVESLFLKQKVSMIVTTYSSFEAFKDAPFTYDISPLPYFNEPRTIVVAIGLAVNKQSRQKAAARLLLDYLLSDEAQLSIRQNTLSIPSVKTAAEWIGEESGNRPSRFHMYREIIPTFRCYTDLGVSCNELAAIRDELKFYWSRLDDLDTVLQRLEDKL